MKDDHRVWKTGEALTRSLCGRDQTQLRKNHLCSPSQPGHVGVACMAHSWSPGKHELSLCHNSLGSMKAEQSDRKKEHYQWIITYIFWSLFCVLYLLEAHRQQWTRINLCDKLTLSHKTNTCDPVSHGTKWCSFESCADRPADSGRSCCCRSCSHRGCFQLSDPHTCTWSAFPSAWAAQRSGCQAAALRRSSEIRVVLLLSSLWTMMVQSASFKAQTGISFISTRGCSYSAVFWLLLCVLLSITKNNFSFQILLNMIISSLLFSIDS